MGFPRGPTKDMLGRSKYEDAFSGSLLKLLERFGSVISEVERVKGNFYELLNPMNKERNSVSLRPIGLRL